jgi:hypothetical protein
MRRKSYVKNEVKWCRHHFSSFPRTTTTMNQIKAFVGNPIYTRASVFVASLVAFITSTALTGTGVGDFTFLLSFVLMLYLALHHYYVSHQMLILLSPKEQLVVDGVFAVLLFAAGIGVAAANWWRWLVALFCALALFLAAIIQGVLVYCLFTQCQESNDTPMHQDMEYNNDGTPGAQPVVRDNLTHMSF